MEENSNDIEKLKAIIKENFEEQRKLIAKLETAVEALTSFNGKQMLDSRDMRLMLKVCDRTLIRWRNSGKLPYFKLSGNAIISSRAISWHGRIPSSTSLAEEFK